MPHDWVVLCKLTKGAVRSHPPISVRKISFHVYDETNSNRSRTKGMGERKRYIVGRKID